MNAQDHRKAQLVAAVSTAFLMLIAALLAAFSALVALNGVMDKRGEVALILLAVFLLFTWIAASAFAGWLTKFLRTRFQWGGAVAAVTAIFSASLLGTVFYFISILAAILLAGIK